MITGRDIIYLSSIEWNFLWQGHQEIALRLAGAGNRVLYVENTGVRSPGVHDAGRVALRLKRWAGALNSEGVREVAPNIYVCSPVVLPPFGPRWRREANRRFFLPVILRTAAKLGLRDPMIWTYLPNDTTLELIRIQRKRGSRGLVYYCVADFTQLTPYVEQLEATETELVANCDVVFTSCMELNRKFQPLNQNCHVFPFGVNLDAFPCNGSNAFRTVQPNGHGKPSHQVTRSDSIADLPKPVIGYVGGMHRHVDFGLVKEMAIRRPDWSWVCVGALQAALGDLAGLPNVHLTGERPHAELANYVREFDVCIVPYVNSAYTATVVPTKINEYLALGKPVVSTALPPVCEFNNEHKVLITTDARPDSFLEAIAEALAMPRDEETRLRRRRVAELGDWGARFNKMSKLISESLDGAEAADAIDSGIAVGVGR
ncbi:MAG TPA: glycosyltransferase [Pyrinomonadaceae bacterium]|nr:glycosyltransferase [Pyrinomonadaceae bacterium]